MSQAGYQSGSQSARGIRSGRGKEVSVTVMSAGRARHEVSAPAVLDSDS